MEYTWDTTKFLDLYIEFKGMNQTNIWKSYVIYILDLYGDMVEIINYSYI